MRMRKFILLAVLNLIFLASFSQTQAGTTYFIEATPADGFHWPYYLYVPSSVSSNKILVISNNTGFRDDDLNVHKAAIRMLTPGKTFGEYTRKVGKVMETELIGLGLLDAGEVKKQSEDQPLYKKYFPHGTSHHLGLDVHDYGDRYRKFEPGMVFTCEPGIYIKDEAIGIRIENDILITEDGPVDLTETIPREADEIEDLMNN